MLYYQTWKLGVVTNVDERRLSLNSIRLNDLIICWVFVMTHDARSVAANASSHMSGSTEKNFAPLVRDGAKFISNEINSLLKITYERTHV